ncbi:type II toxin-antitoxin system VapC family toxin [Candidatus Woesearchaeota archaeon]|nr:type II toxin-antitoxin system VapC family toxin [Candidatus Woesearchaeota archaeon]
MNLFLDTSCMVSFFISDNRHQQAKSVIDKVLKGEIQGLISALSLTELCGAVRRRTDQATAKQVKNDIAGLVEKGIVNIIPITNSDAYLASDLAISTGLRGADALIVNAAKQAGCELFTFDEEMKARTEGVVELYEP